MPCMQKYCHQQNVFLKENLTILKSHYADYLIIVKMQNSITINVDFSGGLDLVFDNKTELKLQLPADATVDTAIKELANKHANYKKEMFAINGIIRPGILVLVNDADWQLSDKQSTPLENKDKISFISTLHGG